MVIKRTVRRYVENLEPRGVAKRGPVTNTRGGSNGNRSILARYIAEIRRYPWLTREEEVTLACEAQAGQSDSLDWLIECNLQFVVRVARDYRNRGLPMEDLINEGNLGLIEAARRFDPSQGNRFITWAVWWIRKSILLALSEQAHVVRLPLSQVKKLRAVRAAGKALEMNLKREPTREELSASLPAGLADLDPIHCHGLRCASLDEPVHRDGLENLADSLEDKRQTSVEEQLLNQEATDSINTLYDQLNDQQKVVITCRFGLDGREPLTLEEIGQRIGRSREGVRLIEAKAMERLQQGFRSGGLQRSKNGGQRRGRESEPIKLQRRSQPRSHDVAV